MKEIETRSTSRRSALCSPIVLLESERVRLVFNPAVVDNERNPNACIDGEFIYQRKAASGRWINNRTASLPAPFFSTEGRGFFNPSSLLFWIMAYMTEVGPSSPEEAPLQ
jgi:hypothetical protein